MTFKPKLAEAYPLYWPEGRKRAVYRERAKFGASFARARDDIQRECRLLGGKDIILSTNIPLRLDGLPYAGMAQPKDPGAAVYFHYKDQAVCFACDRWQKVEDNLRAIALTIEALRGIARWGTGDMLAAAFRGFQALPAPSASRTWREVLGFPPDRTPPAGEIENNYKVLRSKHHPDRGGDAAQFIAVQRAYQQACAEMGING